MKADERRLQNTVGPSRSWEFICGLTDFSSLRPSAILSISSDKCRRRHDWNQSVPGDWCDRSSERRRCAIAGLAAV